MVRLRDLLTVSLCCCPSDVLTRAAAHGKPLRWQVDTKRTRARRNKDALASPWIAAIFVWPPPEAASGADDRLLECTPQVQAERQSPQTMVPTPLYSKCNRVLMAILILNIRDDAETFAENATGFSKNASSSSKDTCEPDEPSPFRCQRCEHIRKTTCEGWTD